MSEFVLYEASEGIATLTLDRPEAANAQNAELLDQLDAAWRRAADDTDVRVIVLQANGKHFSSGHDTVGGGEREGDERRSVTLWWDHSDMSDPESLLAFEEEVYMGMCRRWRELPKPTIAAVHGACIGGGLSLAWSCDLIVASEDAFFSDPVVSMGCPGIEFFCHPWVLGPRHAKEFLYTGMRMPAQRAYELGMVNRVVARDDLDSATVELAERIAERPRYALALTKKAVNACEDEMGMRSGMETTFALHSLSHEHNKNVGGYPVLITDPQALKKASQ